MGRIPENADGALHTPHESIVFDKTINGVKQL
jgi:hypothetical protein